MAVGKDGEVDDGFQIINIFDQVFRNDPCLHDLASDNRKIDISFSDDATTARGHGRFGRRGVFPLGHLFAQTFNGFLKALFARISGGNGPFFDAPDDPLFSNDNGGTGDSSDDSLLLDPDRVSWMFPNGFSGGTTAGPRFDQSHPKGTRCGDFNEMPPFHKIDGRQGGKVNSERNDQPEGHFPMQKVPDFFFAFFNHDEESNGETVGSIYRIRC